MSRKIDPEGARAAIVDAARALFSEQGFHATTIKQIAERANVTKSLIHHHFGNKQDLWGKIQYDMLGTYFQSQRALLMSRDPDTETMRESLKLYFNHHRDNQDIIRMMSWMRLEMSESFEDMSEGLTGFAVERLKIAQDRGEFRDDVHPFYMMVTFFLLIEAWFTHRVDIQKRFDIGLTGEELDDAWLDAATRIMLDGIRSRKAP